MYILKYFEDYGYDGSFLYIVCVSTNKEILEELIPNIEEEIKNYFLDVDKFRKHLDDKYADERINCRRTDIELEEMKIHNADMKQKYLNLSKFNLFEIINKHCESKEFIIEEKIQI